jgi:hypothetical protein
LIDPSSVDDVSGGEPGARSTPRGLGAWRSFALLFVFYLTCYIAATFPAVLSFSSRLPSPNDPLQHLWIMRWYQQCVCSGRLPFECPRLQYPVGASLGAFSPLIIQSLGFVILSSIVHNDILCYNVLSAVGFVTTGLATYLLARHVTRDRQSASLAGLLAMLSGPMMLHGLGHLELVCLGGFPLFLLAWMRFIDQPNKRRLAAVVGSYWLVTMCAAYFAVLSVVPAACYVAHGVWRARVRWRAWCVSRAAWLLAFAAVSLPGLGVLFSSQLWASWHGASLERRKVDSGGGVALLSYATPTSFHPLGRTLGPAVSSEPDLETGSYLGFVTLGLLAIAAGCRAPFPRASFWWSVLVVLVVLSLGYSTTIGAYRVDLPATWLRRSFFAFRLLRSTCRFNLLVAVCAAIPSSVGFRLLLDRCRAPVARRGLFAVFVALALVDLSVQPSQERATVPRLPSAYAVAFRGRNSTAIVDAPQFSSGSPALLNALAGYWQSRHLGRTTAGYSGVPNVTWDNLMYYASPFATEYLGIPGYLRDPADASIDLIHHVAFKDYVWLYLTAHRIDRVILHADERLLPEAGIRLDRIQAELHDAMIYQGSSDTVYDRERIDPPHRPTIVCTAGWRERVRWENRGCRLASDIARLAVYNPDGDCDLTLVLDAAAIAEPRDLHVMSEHRELASWRVTPGVAQILVSPSFQIPAGLGELRLECTNAVIASPTTRRDRTQKGTACLRVAGICLKPAHPQKSSIASSSTASPR